MTVKLVTWEGDFAAVPITVVAELDTADGYADILSITVEDSKVNIINLFRSSDLEQINEDIYFDYKEGRI